MVWCQFHIMEDMSEFGDDEIQRSLIQSKEEEIEQAITNAIANESIQVYVQ